MRFVGKANRHRENITGRLYLLIVEEVNSFRCRVKQMNFSRTYSSQIKIASHRISPGLGRQKRGLVTSIPLSRLPHVIHSFLDDDEDLSELIYAGKAMPQELITTHRYCSGVASLSRYPPNSWKSSNLAKLHPRDECR
jgi:hypothetical protein